MNLKAILAKVAKGEALTDAEKKFLAEYEDHDDADSNRIPKSRLDQEIAKTKAEKERADALEAKLTTLSEQVEELQNAGKSEADKAKAKADKDKAALEKQVSELTKARDEASAKAAKMERDSKVGELAAKHKFSDSKYLGFLLTQGEVDLANDDAVSTFVKSLEKSSPELFSSSAKPGAGTGTGNDNKGVIDTAKARIAELNGKASLSSREVAEVIELQTQISEKSDGVAGADAGGNK